MNERAILFLVVHLHGLHRPLRGDLMAMELPQKSTFLKGLPSIKHPVRRYEYIDGKKVGYQAGRIDGLRGVVYDSPITCVCDEYHEAHHHDTGEIKEMPVYVRRYL